MEEEFRDILGYEGLYQVSNLGIIKSLERIDSNGHKQGNLILIPKINKRGYFKVELCKNGKRKTREIHQLVAIAFLNHIPNGHEIVINHKNEIKIDNRLDNLELCSHRYNDIYSRENKTGFTGVSKSNKKYIANITINNKKIYLGTFNTPEEASNAYQEAYKKIENK